MPRTFAFIHGKNPALSQAELQALFAPEISFQGEWFSVVETDRSVDQSLQNRLGGTVKIAEVFSTDPVEELLNSASSEKIVFGLSQYGGHERLSDVLQAIKDELRDKGRNARFINKDFKNISSGQLNKTRLLEKGIDLVRFFYEGKEHWAKTITFQDIDAYSQRDYDKPKRDMKVGMMPPKLCQLMINLAQAEPETTVYDPFCGLGGILMEAELMDYPLLGSDLKGRMIDCSIKNLDWLRKRFETSAVTPLDDQHFFQQDATQAFPANKMPKNMAVVTEGYLGPPQLKLPTADKRQEIFELLHRINGHFFANISPFIRSGNRLVMTFPYFRSQKERFFYPEEALKTYASAGFAIHNKLRSLLYERETQVVGREVLVFERL